MATIPERISFHPRSNVAFRNLKAGENVVFFGTTLGTECPKCGAYEQTSAGHKYCAHVSCPIALIELKRRKRRRTSNLEKVYAPRFTKLSAEPEPTTGHHHPLS